MMICRVPNKTSALGTLSIAGPASAASFNISAEVRPTSAVSNAQNSDIVPASR